MVDKKSATLKQAKDSILHNINLILKENVNNTTIVNGFKVIHSAYQMILRHGGGRFGRYNIQYNVVQKLTRAPLITDKSQYSFISQKVPSVCYFLYNTSKANIILFA